MAKPNPKKSVRKSEKRLEPKGWSEPERQSLEDVAAQWGTSISYVEECVRTLKFNHIILVTNSGPGLPVTDHFVFNKDCWPFGDTTMNYVGASPPVLAYFCKPSTYPNGFSWPSRTKVYIPVEEVKRMQKEKGGKRDDQQIFLDADYHSKCLEAANYCSHHLYGLGKFNPKRSHKSQIMQLLEEKYGDEQGLTAQMKQSIARIVNKNRRGGAPRQDIV